MKTMKKLSVIALVLLVGFGMVACGPKDEDPEYAPVLGTWKTPIIGDAYWEQLVLEEDYLKFTDQEDGVLEFYIDSWEKAEADTTAASSGRPDCWKLLGEMGEWSKYSGTANSVNKGDVGYIYLYFDDYDEPEKMSRSQFSKDGTSKTQSEYKDIMRIFDGPK